MSKVEVTAERAIDAPAETVYGYLANLQEHRRFLPPLSRTSRLRQVGSVLDRSCGSRYAPEGVNARTV